MNRRMKCTVFALALVAAAVFATSALAQGSGTLCKVYCNKGHFVQKQVSGSAPFTPPDGGGSGGGGQLPFTGLDLGFIALAGVLLVLAGVGLHRATRKPPESPVA
jgi:hypothetical protein